MRGRSDALWREAHCSVYSSSRIGWGGRQTARVAGTGRQNASGDSGKAWTRRRCRQLWRRCAYRCVRASAPIVFSPKVVGGRGVICSLCAMERSFLRDIYCCVCSDARVFIARVFDARSTIRVQETVHLLIDLHSSFAPNPKRCETDRLQPSNGSGRQIF